MYTFDTTGDSCDILRGSEWIANVPDIETAQRLCDELNKVLKHGLDSQDVLPDLSIPEYTPIAIGTMDNCPDCGGWLIRTARYVFCTNCGSTGVPKQKLTNE